MNDKMTCERFSEGLSDFVAGRMSPADAAEMMAHLESCECCREIFAVKRTLYTDALAPAVDVPPEVEGELYDSVISGVAAAGQSGSPRRSWISRYMVPAMAAAIVIFVFATGFLLGEIRGLRREAGELRGEIAVMERVLDGRAVPVERAGRRGSVFGRMTGGLKTGSGEMTISEVSRLLEAIPADTPVLSEKEAERLIASDPRLRRFAGYVKERPWEGGLTSGELLLMIIALNIDPETRIPDGWIDPYGGTDDIKKRI
jgi:hypothetical protein